MNQTYDIKCMERWNLIVLTSKMFWVSFMKDQKSSDIPFHMNNILLCELTHIVTNIIRGNVSVF